MSDETPLAPYSAEEPSSSELQPELQARGNGANGASDGGGCKR